MIPGIWIRHMILNVENVVIDNFLKSPDAFNPCIGKTYVLLSSDGQEIVGFYNINTSCLLQEIDSQYIKIGSSVHISYFAIDEKYHGWKQVVDNQEYNISDLLLTDCIERIALLQDRIGFSFITLNSTQAGCSLYKRNDFEEIEEDMFLPSPKEEKNCIAMYYPMEQY